MAVELPATPNASDDVSISGFFTKVLNSLTWLSLLYQKLPLQDSIAPLSDVTAAPIDLVESSGAAPNPVWYRMPLDADADEGRQWDFILDRKYIGSPVLKVHYYMAGANTSDAVVLVCQIAAVSDTDASVTAKVFDAVNTSTTTVPDAAGTEDVASITLTNADSMAAGDRISLLLYRDANAGGDTAAGDCVVTGVELQFLPY
jgi:hypothetical protein